MAYQIFDVDLSILILLMVGLNLLGVKSKRVEPVEYIVFSTTKKSSILIQKSHEWWSFVEL